MEKHLKIALEPIAKLLEDTDVSKIYTVAVSGNCSKIWFYANKKWREATTNQGTGFMLGENYIRSLVLKLASIGVSSIPEGTFIFECELSNLGFNGTLILQGDGVQNSAFLLNRIIK